MSVRVVGGPATLRARLHRHGRTRYRSSCDQRCLERITEVKSQGDLSRNWSEGLTRAAIDPTNRHVLRDDVVRSYAVAELVTLARDGAPVCWPMMPAYERERLAFSTGLMYPMKARNARRDPRVAALFSDPTASGRSQDDPFVLVQGLAEVFDHDIQRNTERYIAQLMGKSSLMRFVLRSAVGRKAMAGYLARIWIEVIPQREHVWDRGSALPPAIGFMSRPASFVVRAPVALDRAMPWLRRYPRPPVLAYLDEHGWSAAVRVHVAVRSDHIEISGGPRAEDGAPACLTYHRLIGNYRANDAFLIRGHMRADRFFPEKLVGYGGTRDDRGIGSLKLLAFIGDLTRRLPDELARQGRPPLKL